MNLRRSFICLASLCLLMSVLTSCEFKYPEVRKVRELKLKGYNPLSKTLSLSYKPTVHNPNEVSFWVDKVETELLFDGVSLGSTQSEQRIDLPAQKESEFQLDQKIKVDKFLKQLKNVMKKDSIKIEVDGMYTFKAKDFTINVPYVYEHYLHPKRDLAQLLFGL